MILFLSEQIGVPQGTRSAMGTLKHLGHCCNVPSVRVTLEIMKKSESTNSSDEQPRSTFSKALASVLSASSKQIRESRDAAKKEKFSSHTRLKYFPAKQP